MSMAVLFCHSSRAIVPYTIAQIKSELICDGSDLYCTHCLNTFISFALGLFFTLFLQRRKTYENEMNTEQTRTARLGTAQHSTAHMFSAKQFWTTNWFCLMRKKKAQSKYTLKQTHSHTFHVNEIEQCKNDLGRVRERIRKKGRSGGGHQNTRVNSFNNVDNETHGVYLSYRWIGHTTTTNDDDGFWLKMDTTWKCCLGVVCVHILAVQYQNRACVLYNNNASMCVCVSANNERKQQQQRQNTPRNHLANEPLVCMRRHTLSIVYFSKKSISFVVSTIRSGCMCDEKINNTLFRTQEKKSNSMKFYPYLSLLFIYMSNK